MTISQFEHLGPPLLPLWLASFSRALTLSSSLLPMIKISFFSPPFFSSCWVVLSPPTRPAAMAFCRPPPGGAPLLPFFLSKCSFLLFFFRVRDDDFHYEAGTASRFPLFFFLLFSLSERPNVLFPSSSLQSCPCYDEFFSLHSRLWQLRSRPPPSSFFPFFDQIDEKYPSAFFPPIGYSFPPSFPEDGAQYGFFPFFFFPLLATRLRARLFLNLPCISTTIS